MKALSAAELSPRETGNIWAFCANFYARHNRAPSLSELRKVFRF